MQLKTREYTVEKARVINTREELTKLVAGCPPDVYQLVEGYLTTTDAHDKMLLAAWAKCGRNDRKRSVSLRLSEAAASTVSPLGIACLLAYGRAWLDVAEVDLARRLAEIGEVP